MYTSFIKKILFLFTFFLAINAYAINDISIANENSNQIKEFQIKQRNDLVSHRNKSKIFRQQITKEKLDLNSYITKAKLDGLTDDEKKEIKTRRDLLTSNIDKYKENNQVFHNRMKKEREDFFNSIKK